MYCGIVVLVADQYLTGLFNVFRMALRLCIGLVSVITLKWPNT